MTSTPGLDASIQVTVEAASSRPMLTVAIVVDEGKLSQTVLTLSDLGYHEQLEILLVTNPAQCQLVLDAVTSPHIWRAKAHVRVVPWQPGTAALNTIFTCAQADWVICLRPGTRLEDGALSDLANFAAAHPHCRDLLQGPMAGNAGGQDLTHLKPVWHRGRFGVPGDGLCSTLSPGGTVEIGLHRLDVFACRKACWPGIHPRLAMSEGPAGYLHKKFRAQQGRALCVPFLRWSTTIDDRPQDPAWEPTQFFEYLLCWEDTGEAVEPILDHYAEGRGTSWVDRQLAHWHAARNNPFDTFDAIVCINSDRQPDRWARISARFDSLGIAEKVQRLPATLTPERYPIGCALSHRRIVEEARTEGLDSILVFEDDAVFLHGAIWVLRHSVRELMKLPWKLFYLGGFYSDQRNPLGIDNPVPGASFLRHAPGLVTTHAVAYHRRAFDQILDELPADPESMGDFLAGHGGHIDVYYAETFNEGVYRCQPTIASQESYIHLEHPHLRDQFPITP
ncbi:glycosyltransferase family 25 protein [Nocardia sp. NPDC006044]|uniref:glycosyltransferase family 25 protein n=1 Tax=Nocardia sp. NPDC006044 TaxID=3364306 RepID=UPI0036A2EF01